MPDEFPTLRSDIKGLGDVAAPAAADALIAQRKRSKLSSTMNV